MKSVLLVGLTGLSLIQAGGCPPLLEQAALPGARVTTSMGTFDIELDAENAPLTGANFLRYADDGFYDGTLFHQVSAGSFVQAGVYTTGLVTKETGDPMADEADNGLANERGAVALARGEDPDTVTPGFVINLATSPEFDPPQDSTGYTVFGRVAQRLDVVERIAAVATQQRDGLTDVPVEDVIIQSIEFIEIPTGAIELTPEGEAYLESQRYHVLNVLRDLLVDILGRVIVR